MKTLTKSHLKLVVPSTIIGTVDPRHPPTRRPNAELRSREYLTKSEVERLIKACDNNRWRHRDAVMVRVAWRHGLRACELVSLRWDDVDFEGGYLHVRRAKNGKPSTHRILGSVLRDLRRWKRDQDPASPYVFTSERAAKFTTGGFGKMIARLGKAAGFNYGVHPHQLRHACGFALANLGVDTRRLQDFLGHKNIAHTVKYTELSPSRLKDIWGNDD
jgi:integrase